MLISETRKHYESIIKKIRNNFPVHRIDAYLSLYPPHIRYLSGFSGKNAACLIIKGENYLVVDKKFIRHAIDETTGWVIIKSDGDPIEYIHKKKLISENWKIGIDGNNTPYAKYLELKKIFSKNKIIPISELIEKTASVKENYEIECIKTAIGISTRTFYKILDIIFPGIRELDISAEITYLHKVFGAEDDAFPPIVASGKNASTPHPKTSDKRIKTGEMVTIDFGCSYRGYNCDITRTIFIGKPVQRYKKIYEIILEAQKLAIEKSTHGISCKEIDSIARNFIEKNGYGKYFTHSLGHGIGISIHEAPHISHKSNEIIQKGNVVTIEPGIYFPNYGGIRVEDMILITNKFPEILTSLTKELIIL